MEPATNQTVLQNLAPLDKDPDPASDSAAGVGRTQHVQGKASALYLKLLSLRVGLVGWYFCLKKIQWDLLRWIHISLELATDVFFSWLQNALLASMMLLLLAWKVHSGAKQLGWRTLLRGLTAELQHAWDQSPFRTCFCSLKSFVVWTIWAPACCFTWITCYLVRALEAIFIKTVMMAGEETEEEAAAEVLSEPLSALALPREERDQSHSQ